MYRVLAGRSPRAGPGPPDRAVLSCPGCDRSLETERLRAAALWVCYRCGYHFRLRPLERMALLADAGSLLERDRDLVAPDPLGFIDSVPYASRIEEGRARCGSNEAVIWGDAAIGGEPLVFACLDFAFMGGSMGTATGEMITNAIEAATRRRVPLLIVTASGGARMQEGIFSLMQMAKTAAALGRLGAAGIPYVSLLTDPTMGGVTASFASLADVILAEPGAMIGFAGARVIQQATYETLPEGFQTAEFLWQHGMIDLVVPRPELPAVLRQLLDLYVKNEAAKDFELEPQANASAPTPAVRG